MNATPVVLSDLLSHLILVHDLSVIFHQSDVKLFEAGHSCLYLTHFKISFDLLTVLPCSNITFWLLVHVFGIEVNNKTVRRTDVCGSVWYQSHVTV